MKFLSENQGLVPLHARPSKQVLANSPLLIAGVGVTSAGAWLGHCSVFYLLGIA
jgi:hypothetical protein